MRSPKTSALLLAVAIAPLAGQIAAAEDMKRSA